MLFSTDGLGNFPSPSYRDIPALTIGKDLKAQASAPPPSYSDEDQDEIEKRLKDLGYLLKILFTAGVVGTLSDLRPAVASLGTLSLFAGFRLDHRSNQFMGCGWGCFLRIIICVPGKPCNLCSGSIARLFDLNKWIENKRVALMGTFVIVLSFWSILNQTYFLRAVTPSGQILSLFAGTGRPLIALYITALFLIGLTVILPTYFILRSEKAEKIVLDGFERFSLLMTLYLFFDFIALVIVLVRNF
ncbi:MAG: hypothetical protein IPP55_16540 [Anaerolineales bacterium]|nr:hypothetical protein [Anaerolineales bacterium]